MKRRPVSGINVDRIKIIVYAACGFLSALAGSSLLPVCHPHNQPPAQAMNWMLSLPLFWAVPVSLVVRTDLGNPDRCFYRLLKQCA